MQNGSKIVKLLYSLLLVVIRLDTHMTEHHLEDPFQSAYHGWHNIETALLWVHNNILWLLDDQKVMLLVPLDL